MPQLLPAPSDREGVVAFLRNSANLPYDLSASFETFLNEAAIVAYSNIRTGMRRGFEYDEMLENAANDFQTISDHIVRSRYKSPHREFWEEVRRRFCPILFVCKDYNFHRERRDGGAVAGV